MFARKVAQWTWQMVLGYVQSTQDAEEIVQDTLLAALNGLIAEGRQQQWRGDASLKSWVYSIARHKAMDALRKKYTQKRSAKVIPLHPDPESEGPLPFEPVDFIHPGVQLESQEQMQLFFTGINALPILQKEALLLARFEQMPVKEIAEVMDTTPKAVESLLQRAKQNFKTFLAERGVDIQKSSRHGSTE